jgi:hypothetical protein
MSVEVERATVSCGVCGARVSELRRGRCWGCYVQWTDQRPVGRGAACAVCQERRRDRLRLVELHTRSVPLCHSCAARTVKLAEVPPSLEALRSALRRDRRDEERRSDGLDRRIFPRERRVGERRGTPRARRGDTDPSLALPDFDDLVIEIDEGDIEELEQTVVKQRPAGTT